MNTSKLFNSRNFTLIFVQLYCFISQAQNIDFREITANPNTTNQISDINNDGILDAIIINGGKLTYRIGTSDSSTTNTTNSEIITSFPINTTIPGILEIKDINNDNKKDIVVIAGSPLTLKIYHNDFPNFIEVKSEVLSSNMFSPGLILIDFDGDFDDDLVFSDGLSIKSMINNNGFYTNSIIQFNMGFGNPPGAFQKANINNDNVDDIVFGYMPSSGNGAIMAITNLPNQPFFQHGTLPFNTLNNGVIQTGLLDTDSEFDLVFLTQSDEFYFNSTLLPIHVYQAIPFPNDSDPNPEYLVLTDTLSLMLVEFDLISNQFNVETVSNSDLNWISNISLKDLNNDNYIDVVARDANRTFVYFNNGYNNFINSAVINFKHIGSTEDFSYNDINNDEKSDLIFSFGLCENINHVDYSFPRQINMTDYSLTSKLLVDIDNDLDLDIVGILYAPYFVFNGNIAYVYQLNDGNGNFSSPIVIDLYIPGSNDFKLSSVDINSDGSKDLIVEYMTYYGYRGLDFYLNNSLSFTKTSFNYIQGQKVFAFEDKNSDGFLDVLSYKNGTYPITDASVYYQLFNGTSISPTFNLIHTISNITVYSGISSDYDIDGDLDFLFRYGVNSTVLENTIVLKNTGSNIYINALNENVTHQDVTFYDIDEDSDLDILYAQGDSISYYTNNGLGTFGSLTSILLNNIQIDQFRNENLKTIDSLKKSLLGLSYQGDIFEITPFKTGNLPLFSSTNIDACPDDLVTISVQNAAELFDNSTWALFEDSCNSNFPVLTSSSGIFNYSTLVNKTIYIKAIGNGNLTGPCQSINVNVTNISPIYTLSNLGNTNTNLTLSPSGIPNINWEYSTNNGTSWISTALNVGELNIPLTPNSLNDLLIRPSGIAPSCSVYSSEYFEIQTNCDPENSFDTLLACQFQNLNYLGQNFYIDVNPIDTSIYLINIYGCDSIINLHIDTIPIAIGYDTIYVCLGETFTAPDGNILTASYDDLYYSNFTSSLGCDSSHYTLIDVIDPSYTSENFQICYNSNYQFPDGLIVNNITTDYYHESYLTNSYGCDSVIYTYVYTLVDTVYEDYYLCAGQSYTFPDGFSIPYLTVDVIHNSVYLNQFNCDSLIIKTSLFVTADSITNHHYLCAPEDVYTYDGNVLLNVDSDTVYFSYDIFGLCSVVIIDSVIFNGSIVSSTNTFSSPSSSVSCTGQLTITTTGNPDFEMSIDGSAPFSSSGYSLQSNLCPGIHELSVVDFCGDTVSQTFVIPVDSNYVFYNPFIDSIAVDSLGTSITNCDIYYNSIDTAYIDSLWATGNQVNVIWNIVDSNGSNLDTTTYDLMNGSGVYWLQLSVFCPTKAVDDYFAVTQAIYFGNGGAYLVGLENEFKQNHSTVSIYPNPTSGNLSIEFNSNSQAHVFIYDAQGKLLQSIDVYSGDGLSLEEYEQGVYFMSSLIEGNNHFFRIVKN